MTVSSLAYLSNFVGITYSSLDRIDEKVRDGLIIWAVAAIRHMHIRRVINMSCGRGKSFDKVLGMHLRPQTKHVCLTRKS